MILVAILCHFCADVVVLLACFPRTKFRMTPISSFPLLKERERSVLSERLTLVDFTEGTRAELLDDLETTFQDFLSVLEHVADSESECKVLFRVRSEKQLFNNDSC